PAADRQALLEEERQAAVADSDEGEKPRRNGRRRKSAKPAATGNGDAVQVSEEIAGMTVLDPSEGETVLVEELPTSGDAGDEPAETAEPAEENASEHSDEDDGIESVAEEDVAEEIRAPKKPRARRYKIQEVIKVRQIML